MLYSVNTLSTRNKGLKGVKNSIIKLQSTPSLVKIETLWFRFLSEQKLERRLYKKRK